MRRAALGLLWAVALGAPGAASAQKRVKLPETWGARPFTVELMRTQTPTRDMMKAGMSNSQCKGKLPDDPQVVLEITKLPDPKYLWVDYRGKGGYTDSLVVITPTGGYHCFPIAFHLIKLNVPWKPGKYELYVASDEPMEKPGILTFVNGQTIGEANPKKVWSLPGGIEPNPTGVPIKAGPREAEISDFHFGMQSSRSSNGYCDKGSVTSWEPAAAFDLKNPPEKLKASVKNGSIMVVNEKGGAWCGRTHTFDGGWGAGVWRFFVLDGKAGDELRLEFWDPETPAPPVDRSVATTKVSTKFKKPIVIAGTVQTELTPPWFHERDQGCWRGGRSWARKPDAMIEFERPLVGISLHRTWSHDDYQVRLYGPLDLEGFEPKDVFCDLDGKSRRVEGTYAVYVGGRKDSAGKPFRLYLMGPAVPKEPLRVMSEYGPEEKVRDRYLGLHMPGLETRATPSSALHLRLFAEVKSDLFVYPKFDLDEATARIHSSGVTRVFYPKKNEPMLVTGTKIGSPARYWELRREGRLTPPKKIYVRTIDGVTLLVEERYLLTAPDGRAAPPSKWRMEDPKDLRDSRRIGMAGPEDEKMLTRFRKLEEKSDKCWNAYWDRHYSGLDSPAGYDWDIVEVTRIGGKVVRAESLTERATKKTNRVCKVAQVKKEAKRLAKKLDVSRTKRRARLIKEFAARFSR